MFWETELNQPSLINDLLDSDDCNLTAVIEDELVVQEIRADNKKLIELYVIARLTLELIPKLF